jgi:oligopeptide/dipeptide ABC transporter ATP-binding protein
MSASAISGPAPLLEVKELQTYFFTRQGPVRAVDGVTFSIQRKEAVAIVGESGSGKSATALSIMRLVPLPGRILKGKIILGGMGDLATKSEQEMQRIRGRKIAMSFQDPFTFLNPVIRVGDQISEAVTLHHKISEREARARAVDIMKSVGIQSAEQRYNDFPHQFSGGMRQRILLAIAISCDPELLIADEPTTALDVIAQSEILKLLRDLKARFNTSLLLITHDLAIASNLCDKFIIMYAGKIMEMGNEDDIFVNSKHPYTRGLLESLPKVRERVAKLRTIEGSLPSLLNPPGGCRFNPRCPYAIEKCRSEEPPLFQVGVEHYSSCHRISEIFNK